MKTLFLFLAITISYVAKAQILKVNLAASGLTCSMCSNSINKALKSLDFVENIEADIKSYTFIISFKEDSKVDFDKIKNKVEGAGFSVSKFIAYVCFDNLELKEKQILTIDNQIFHFINTKEQILNGIKAIKILNSGFLAPKEFKKLKKGPLLPLSYYASI